LPMTRATAVQKPMARASGGAATSEVTDTAGGWYQNSRLATRDSLTHT
jgi:hypothetical protein